MKPEMLPGTVLEGKPRLTRVKRLVRFGMEAVNLLPKPAESIEELRYEEKVSANRLGRRGRKFLHTLRGTFGESLRAGVVVRPTMDHPYAVTVKAVSRDTEVSQMTVAEIGIVSAEGHLTRLAVGTTEPTVGARHLAANVPQADWVRVVDPSDPKRTYGFSDFNKAEREGLVAITDQALSEVETACDQGACEVYAQVA